MDPETAAMLAFIRDTPFSEETRMGMLLRLLSRENVRCVTGALPAELRTAFERYLRGLLLERGEPFNVDGRPVPEASLSAARAWLAEEASRRSALIAGLARLVVEVPKISPGAFVMPAADLGMFEPTSAAAGPRVPAASHG